VLDTFSGRPAWHLAVLAASGAFLAAIAAYDARHHRIPNRAIYPAILAALAFAFVRPDGPWWSFLAAGLVGGGGLMLIGILSNGGMGFGDAKLAAFIGLMTGWPLVLAALFVGFAAGSVAGVAMIASRRIKRSQPIAFGPPLAGGAIAAMLFGPQLMHVLWPWLV
jgi:prepilin signal peptidase PulO-like enzyme (type II secretory pathway)